MNNKEQENNKFDQAVKVIAEADISAPAGFTTKVMAHLEDEQSRSSWRYIMEVINRYSLRASALVGTCAVALFCILIMQEQEQVLKEKEKQIFQKETTNKGKASIPAPSEIKYIDTFELRVEKALRNVPGLSAAKKKIFGKAKEGSTQGAQAPVLEKRKKHMLPEDVAQPAAPALQLQRGRVFVDQDSENLARFIPESNTEQYQNYGENLPTLVTKEPVSTFSIDVDTGSYTNARRFLTNGNLPPKDAVRIEEFINYFDYNYPSQSEDPFALSYEIAPNPLDKDKYLLKLGVKAKDIQEDRKAWNLVFLVDVSGSMNSPKKLPLLKQSLKFLTKNLQAQDRVSLVTYAGSSRVVLESTPASEQSKILEAIDLLSSGGSTYGSAGIQKAYELARSGYKKGGVNRVIIATDGDFNVGITDRSQLINLIEQKRKSNITLTTIGFGTGNYNEAMMEQLANKGNGNHFYIDNFREARKVFGEDLAGTLQVVAKDVKLQIEFNPNAVAQYRLIGYENRKLENHQFNDDKIDAGEIGSGHTVTALYEVVLTGTEQAKKLELQHRYEQNKKAAPKKDDHTSELAFLKVRYKAPTGDTSKLLTFPIERDQVRELKNTSEDFIFASVVSAFAHKLRASSFAPTVEMSELIALAKSSKGSDKNGNRAEFIHLMENVAATIEK